MYDQLQRGSETLKLRKAFSPIPIMHPILSRTVRKGGKTRHVGMGKDKLTTSSFSQKLLYHFLAACSSENLYPLSIYWVQANIKSIGKLPVKTLAKPRKYSKIPI